MNKKIIKIVEVGINHMGSEKYLNDYIKSVSKKKVDGITIQILTKEFYKGEFKNFSLTDKQIVNFIKKAKKEYNLVGIAINDYKKINLLSKHNIDFFKVLSPALGNISLIKKLIKTNVKKIYLSTGLSSYKEINETLKKIDTKKINLIHTSFKKTRAAINFQRISILKKKFGLPVSYGNHSPLIKTIPHSIFFKPESIFFYIKLNKNLNYPDNNHAIKIKSVTSILKSVKKNEEKLAKN